MLTRRTVVVAVGATLVAAAASAPSLAKPAVEGVVNLNTATAEELELLPGIGPAKVELILAYRRVRKFRTVEEIVRIKGIGHRMLRKLRPHLAIAGPTTIKPAGTAAPRAAPDASE